VEQDIKKWGRAKQLGAKIFFQFAPLIDNSVHWTMLTYC